MTALLAFVLAVGGLHGVVTRGPIMPVCNVGTQCSGPAVGTVLVFSRAGRAAARVRTGVNGRYSVRLQAGLYTVRVSPQQHIGSLSPVQAHVRGGASSRLDFAIDTGIR
jgi:hypothetical protein